MSAASLKGAAFEEVRILEEKIAATSPGGTEPKGSKKPERIVHLDLPKESLHLVKKLKGMETFNPSKHCLEMVKGGFGLKDAPRMWRLRLDFELKKCGLKACQADGSIYCKHRWNNERSAWDLVLSVSTHVDDLKGGGVDSEVQALVKQLTAAFGQGKLQLRALWSKACARRRFQNHNDYGSLY